MFSDLDQAFAALRDRTPEPRFVPAADVRRRGRRRGHRSLVLTAAAAVVAAVVAAGALVTFRGDEEVTPPAATATIPDVWLLRPDDVPPDFRNPVYDEDVMSWQACVHGKLPGLHGPRQRATRTVNYHSANMLDPHMMGQVLQIRQRVALHDDGWAARAVAEYQAWIDRCDPGMFQVVGRGVAGDESVLWLVRTPGMVPQYVAVVRVGDRVSSLELSLFFTGDQARQLMVDAGRRLAS